jgi:sugar phosphate isomerase/epimerase
MRLGMYSIEIERPSVAALFSAASGYGFTEMQFDFTSMGGEQMPEKISAAQIAEIRKAAADNGIRIVSVNGTFNMIHPEKAVRLEGVKRFEVIAEAAAELGGQIVTLCTGSRNADNMWSRSEDNDKPEAFSDLLEITEKLIPIAEKCDIVLGVEPEPTNAINSADKARKLLDTFQSPRLKIIMDGANLFRVGNAYPENVRGILDHAFALLSKDICLAHGKDVKAGPGLDFTYAGNGILDFDYFLRLFKASGYKGGMILHGVHDEKDFPAAVKHVTEAAACIKL